MPIALTATYTGFGMTHVINSRLELDIRNPGTSDLASSLRAASAAQSGSSGNAGMEGGMEAYLDDDDDDMMFMGGHNAFSSEQNTPPTAITPVTANPQNLLYIPSQSLQNSPLKSGSVGPTPPASAPPLSLTLHQPHPLTPNPSPAALQFGGTVVHSTPRQPSSAPQTPIGGPPSHLTLHIPQHNTEMSSPLSAPGSQQAHFHYLNGNDANQPMMYGLQTHMRLSPPASAESGGRMNDIDEELHDSSMSHGYFDDSYTQGLGSPFLER